ncbi:hypothetical protein NQ315_014844 [Exocentrus adspersus]|uniref:Uncharacterized protein n=1 Tax=Exocentrus adspersus TaxID=1586481 RepID=A0AAV8VKV4_9CUCU|nr:hypothetical protein NQ315_014844 [Exocentrus adspersus]
MAPHSIFQPPLVFLVEISAFTVNGELKRAKRILNDDRDLAIAKTQLLLYYCYSVSTHVLTYCELQISAASVQRQGFGPCA